MLRPRRHWKPTCGTCNWIYGHVLRKIPVQKRSLEERSPHPERALTEDMSDVPKIVHDRLRASAPGGAHPDADVLTAFAEQALSGAEREDLVRHLSRCVDCREAVALSIPPMEAVAPPKADRESVPAAAVATGGGLRAWFAWPNLRWA